MKFKIGDRVRLKSDQFGLGTIVIEYQNSKSYGIKWDITQNWTVMQLESFIELDKQTIRSNKLNELLDEV